MYSYCAVQNINSSGIYKVVSEDEDIEAWQFSNSGSKEALVFPDFEFAVYFESDKELKIGQELVAISFEAFHHEVKKDHFDKAFFTNVRDIPSWINGRIEKFSGKNIDHKPSLQPFWLEDFEVGAWTFCITKITGRVSPDPRDIPWQVKFELAGFKFQIDVDPVKSGFEDYYQNHVSPWLEDVAAAEDKILTEDGEIKRQVLPLLTKILVDSGYKSGYKSFGGDFGTSKAKEITDALKANFELFVL